MAILYPPIEIIRKRKPEATPNVKLVILLMFRII